MSQEAAQMPKSNGIQWSLDNLLQELMLALVGYTGDIFVDNSNHDPRYLHSCNGQSYCW
jgi:hypothetical protein